MIGLTKDKEVLGHWISSADVFTIAPQEFYAAVEKQVADCQIPSLETSRIEISEGGLLTQKRLYLRMTRKRMAFDICASPFGSRYFFSCRTVYLPTQFKIWHFILLNIILGLVSNILLQFLSVSLAALAEVGLIIALGFAFRNAVSIALADIDTTLLKLPLIGRLYEIARKKTYFREDAEMMFLDTIPNIVRTLAEEACAAKGVKLVRQFERAPILGELYKRPQYGLGSVSSSEPHN